MTIKNYLSKTITLLAATIFSISSFAQNNEPMFEEIIVTASSPTAAKRRKREDNENNEKTTRFSPTLHLEERAETEVTVAPDKQPVDVHLHPHQSIAIEGSCGVKVTSAVVCINGYLASVCECSVCECLRVFASVC